MSWIKDMILCCAKFKIKCHLHSKCCKCSNCCDCGECDCDVDKQGLSRTESKIEVPSATLKLE